MGDQTPVDLGPERWVLIQAVLYVVADVTSVIQTQFPEYIQRELRHPGGFPMTRILHEDAGISMIQKVASHVCEHGVSGFRTLITTAHWSTSGYFDVYLQIGTHRGRN